MYTSLILVALTGTIVEGGPQNSSPTWYGDYGIAQKQGVESTKPLAIFIGSGEAGYGKISRKGRLAKEVQRLLADRYVCVYLDTTTASGKAMALAFKVKKGPGLVLSDVTGVHQAFHYKGELSRRELERYLKKYSHADRVVLRT